MTTHPPAVCSFCGKPCDPAGHDTWQQVTVWVFGPKRNGACMQSDEVYGIAHDPCARLVRQGISVDQAAMF